MSAEREIPPMIASSIRSKDDIDFCFISGRGDANLNMGVVSISLGDDEVEVEDEKRFVVLYGQRMFL